jgi:hypothetical protein
MCITVLDFCIKEMDLKLFENAISAQEVLRCLIRQEFGHEE